LRLHALVDLKRLLGRIDNDEAIGAFTDVGFQAVLQSRINVGIQIIVEFLQKLLTG
jgi:hypothetical protein